MELLRSMEDLLSITGGTRSTDNTKPKVEKQREPRVNPPKRTPHRPVIIAVGNASLCSW